jgi:hypothetical protein
MSDPWLGADKLYHCVACAAITAATYAVLGIARRLRTFSAARARLALAVFSGSGAGVAKEVGDYWNFWPA